MCIKDILSLTIITILLTQLKDVNAFTFDPSKSNIEASSVNNQNQRSFTEASAANSRRKVSFANTIETSQTIPGNDIFDSRKVDINLEKKSILDESFEKQNYEWYKWIARLRLYKKKMLKRKNVRPRFQIDIDETKKCPYAMNSKEEEEGFQLSLWVNSQVHQLNIIPKNAKLTTPDHETIQKTKIFLKELDSIHEILPSTMALSEIQNMKTQSKSTLAYENNSEKRKNHDDAWDDQYEKLCRYRTINGHCRVPQNYEEDPSFGRWVFRQRVLYRSIVGNSLNLQKRDQNSKELILNFDLNDKKTFRFKDINKAKERITKLLEINFDFHTQSRHPKQKETWLVRFHDLIQFYQENGHCMVPYKYPKNQSLAYWVNNQRRVYKNAKVGTDPEQTYARWKTLDRMNFRWGTEHTDKFWNQRFEELKKYCKVHGDCNVPYKYPSNPSLGLWVSYQRMEYRQIQSKQKLPNGAKYFLTPAKIKAFKEINFQWDENPSKLNSSLKTKTMEKLEELREFYLLHDHSNVPEDYPPNQNLSIWIQEVRVQYKENVEFPDSRGSRNGKNDCILTNKIIDALNDVNFEWK